MTDGSRTKGRMGGMTEFLFSPATPDVPDFHLVMTWMRGVERKGALDHDRRNRVLGLLAGLFLPPYEPKGDCLSIRDYMCGNVLDWNDPRYQRFMRDLAGLGDDAGGMGPILFRFTLDIRAEKRLDLYGRNVEVMLRDHMRHVTMATPGAVQRLDFLRRGIRDLIGDDPYLGI